MSNRLRTRMPLLGSLALAALIVTLVVPAAQGAALVCTGSKDHLIIDILGLGTTIFAETQGSITMDVGDPTQSSNGTIQRSIRVLEVSSSGDVPNVGSVSFRADTSRNAGPSGTVSLQTGKEFPAQQTVRFHFTVDIEGSGTYRSINPAEVSGTVDSLPPRPGTTYKLTNRVKLEDAAWPGQVAAVVEAGQVFTVETAQ